MENSQHDVATEMVHRHLNNINKVLKKILELEGDQLNDKYRSLNGCRCSAEVLKTSLSENSDIKTVIKLLIIREAETKKIAQNASKGADFAYWDGCHRYDRLAVKELTV